MATSDDVSLDDFVGLKKFGTLATWPCLYGGDLCLAVGVRKEEARAMCIKAMCIKTRWGFRRTRRLRKAHCPRPERKALLGFTRGWVCKFADGRLHGLSKKHDYPMGPKISDPLVRRMVIERKR